MDNACLRFRGCAAVLRNQGRAPELPNTAGTPGDGAEREEPTQSPEVPPVPSAPPPVPGDAVPTAPSPTCPLHGAQQAWQGAASTRSPSRARCLRPQAAQRQDQAEHEAGSGTSSSAKHGAEHRPLLSLRRGPRGVLGVWGPFLSYPHAVALEDVVAVERRGVQGAGRRLVLDGAGERGRAGTQTLGHLRARGGAARHGTKPGGG